MTRVLHTARNSNVVVVVVNDNEIRSCMTRVLAVCRTRVIHELSLMASLSTSSRGSVNRAPARCTGSHGFDSRSILITLSPSLKFAIIYFIIINSLIFSRLFFCSTVWSGTSKQNLNKLQLVQNFAVRIITGLRKYDHDHILPALKELGGLSVEQQLHLRDVTMVYKCVNGLFHLTYPRNSQLAPRYIT